MRPILVFSLSLDQAERKLWKIKTEIETLDGQMVIKMSSDLFIHVCKKYATGFLGNEFAY